LETVIYIDSCAWNYLYDNAVDLGLELPLNQFTIYITREVEIELFAIPDIGVDGKDKRALKKYINQNINRLPVKTSYVFGFRTFELDNTPSPIQVYGGFNTGTFQSGEERSFYANPEIEQQTNKSKKTKSGLNQNQADASLATNERQDTSGPLRSALSLGGKVVYLEAQVKPSGLTIGEYLESLNDIT
jgi:hypothetical protein